MIVYTGRPARLTGQAPDQHAAIWKANRPPLERAREAGVQQARPVPDEALAHYVPTDPLRFFVDSTYKPPGPKVAAVPPVIVVKTRRVQRAVATKQVSEPVDVSPYLPRFRVHEDGCTVYAGDPCRCHEARGAVPAQVRYDEWSRRRP